MEDNDIIKLFNERNETALSELSKKHGTYFTRLAEKILYNHEDSEVCVNDAYLKTWETIPPAKPNVLRAFVGKIVKSIAVSMLRRETAGKRGGGEFNLVLDELEECVSDGSSVEEELDGKQLSEEINGFLKTCTETNRRVFVLRYWYCESVPEIAAELAMSENNVSVSLFRTRQKLKEHLTKEGYII